ncbi:MAG: dihydrolipoyl dehydrogenase [Desulfovibrio sp.]|nr:dihydrolipoyl dehydrogenase [Desulfovibrio sp.]
MTQRITIIGGGPGGYTAAFAAAKAGVEVTLVEASRLGGTCLHTGCIPTKTLKASAEALENARRLPEFGIAGSCEPVPDMVAIRARKRKVTEILCDGLEKTCAKLKVRVVKGLGQVVNRELTRVHAPGGGTVDVPGDRVIIATGSRTLNLPSLPVDHARVLTSDDALELDHVPGRLLVVGGGVIGVELAFIFQALGSRVTVVEGQERVLPVPSIDEDLSRLVQREMKKHGIVFEPASTAIKAEPVDADVRVTLGPSPFVKEPPLAAQKERELEVDAVLVAVGRVPNTEGLGLQEAGVAVDHRGWIVADERMETSVPGIYAIGDVLGPARIMLAHVAETEARVAVANCLGAAERMDYGVVPAAVFVSPELACVGLTEAQARESGLDVICPQSAFRGLGKAQAMGELAGLFKLVVEADSGRVLGAHIAGAHASDLIAEAVLNMRFKGTAADIARAIHAHPTLSEGLQETARLL